MRSFVAIHLGDSSRAAIARLPKPAPARGVRLAWVAERNLHLTLKFLGEVEETLVPDVIGRLAEASRGVPGFEVEWREVGVFPPRGSPRVLWVGCEGGPVLFELKQAIEERLEPLGFETERRPFHPHVTLARIQGRCSPALLEGLLGDRGFGSQQVASIALMSSELQPSGAVHRTVAELKLG
ncbi:MAG: RNA 2',3'-cyclic phosphodiesterase [Planctomycetota bacterium]